MGKPLDTELWEGRRAKVLEGLAQNPPLSQRQMSWRWPDVFPNPRDVANTVAMFPELRRNPFGPRP